MRKTILIAAISLMVLSAARAEPRDHGSELRIKLLRVHVANTPAIAPEMFDPNPTYRRKSAARTVASLPRDTMQ